MLILSRQKDQVITIGDNIVITIVDIRGDKVRLGIEAPREVPVHRQEVYEAILREKGCGDTQHSAPLESDGGPAGVPDVASTQVGHCPDLAVLGINATPVIQGDVL